MELYFAPLEGITDLTFRNCHNKYFPGVNRYFMPFISPTQNHCLTKKEQRELPYRDSLTYDSVPQILTKSADDFLWAAQCCADRGYQEVNLNMGCPSGTVTAKGKGAGMLGNLPHLTQFLEEIFPKSPVKISVKTRIGVESSEEFPKILAILDQYPFTEWIIHPRVRKAFYKGAVDPDAFRYAVQNSKLPVCYNGDIRTLSDMEFLKKEFPRISSLMIGRGLITDPGMLQGYTDRKVLFTFHEELFDEYCRVFASKQNAMCRMKEIWSLLIVLFEDADKYGKKLRRCTDYDVFRQLTSEILYHLTIHPQESVLKEWFLS